MRHKMQSMQHTMQHTMQSMQHTMQTMQTMHHTMQTMQPCDIECIPCNHEHRICNLPRCNQHSTMQHATPQHCGCCAVALLHGCIIAATWKTTIWFHAGFTRQVGSASGSCRPNGVSPFTHGGTMRLGCAQSWRRCGSGEPRWHDAAGVRPVQAQMRFG